jgi:3-phenylpropionate/trans-cinnamate dioxygenase ferredoxin reductase subunit
MRDHTGHQAARIVVVGAGLAGANACSELRKQGYAGRVTLLGDEALAPYDRPPLSKAVLTGKRDDTTLRFDLAALDVDARLATAATGLDTGARVVATTEGDLGYDGLIIATGAAPATLPGDGDQHVLRTVGDARRLRGVLADGARVVIIGAGWIGAEVATAALAAGCRVTCLEAGPTVLHGVLGAVGAEFEPWWSAVDLRFGVLADRVEDGAVRLVGGETIAADAVLVGIGARPATGWLEGSGLTLNRGVVTDDRLQAAPGVAAVGDVAVWHSARFDRVMRVEHWDNASLGPKTAVANLIRPDAGGPRYDPVPYFWSDQFGHKLQYVGAHDDESRVVFRRPGAGAWWAALWLDPADRLTAALTIDRPREMLAARQVIEEGRPVAPVIAVNGDLPLTDAVLGDPSAIRSGFDHLFTE